MVIKSTYLLVLIFITNTFLFSSASATGQDEKSKFDSNKILNLIKKSGIHKKNLGMVISYSQNGEGHSIYSHNEKGLFIPASLTKVITAGAILDKFPKEHRFVTTLKSTAEVKAGHLKGDLYLVGGGDPGFVSESLWKLVNDFTRAGITKIDGDVIIDDSRFDTVRFDPSRSKTRVDRAYDAPIGAMTFNWSSVNIYVRPGEKVGDPVRITADPESPYVTIVNKAKTSRKGKRKKLSVNKTSASKNATGDVITVKGSIGIDQEEAVYYKGITEPEYWAGFQLVEFLKRRGVTITGKVKVGKAPDSAEVLSEVESKSVFEMVKDMMKFSNNYVAEILTKNLSAEFVKKPAEMDAGVNIIRDYVKAQSIAGNDFSLINPSGLTRKNKFRPMDLHKILKSIKNSFRSYPEFLTSLPISGVDGTLKRRLNNGSKEKIRAKTGLLNGVAALGGYAGGKDGRVYTFVFLYNGPHSKTFKAKDLFDKIAALLVKHGN